MSSEAQVYVWIYLPGTTEPVVAGRFSHVRTAGGGVGTFVYGKSYLARPDAVPLDPVALPLTRFLARHRLLSPDAVTALALVFALFLRRWRPVQSSSAASEADRILGTRERISTARSGGPEMNCSGIRSGGSRAALTKET